MYEKAIALDPQYAQAYASLGITYYLEWNWRWSQDPQNLERASELAQRAIALDDSLPGPHELLSWVYLQKKQPDQAIAEGERAIAVDANFADGYANLAEALNWTGRSEEAIRSVEQAMRLNPRYPPLYLFERKRRELHGQLDRMRETLSEPVAVYYVPGEDSYHYYRFYPRTPVSGKYMLIITKHLDGEGFIITCFYARRISKPEKVLLYESLTQRSQ